MFKLRISLLFILTVSVLSAVHAENPIAESSQKAKTNSLPKYSYTEIYDAMANKILHSYKSDKETTIKSGTNKLSFASGTEILISYEDEKNKIKISSIELQLSIFRSQLFSAAKASQVLTMTSGELIHLKPMVPITVILKGGKALISMVQKEYKATGSIVKAMTILDTDYFPALMNVENYNLFQYYQKQDK